MKGKSLLTFVLLVAGFLAAGFPSFAQDVITKKDGTDIQAKVLEVNENEVKYRRYDYLDGPIFTMLKSDILIVRYENGTNDVFNGKGKSVTTVKSEPQPTVTDTEDRDRDDVKKDKKDSKKKSKKESSKKAPVSLTVNSPYPTKRPCAEGICSWYRVHSPTLTISWNCF